MAEDTEPAEDAAKTPAEEVEETAPKAEEAAAAADAAPAAATDDAAPAKEEAAAAAAPAKEEGAAAPAPKADDKDKKPRTAEDIFLELEGEEGAEKNKVLKAKGSKNITVGIVHVAATFNNTIVTVSDQAGNVIGWSTSGKMGFRGSRKSTAYAAQLVSQDACRQAMAHGLKTAEVRVRGPGSGRESAVRAVQGLGIDVTKITDVTPVPHNGCRPKKARRV